MKRLLDLAIVVPGVIVAFPFLLLLSCILFYTIGWPVFFFQKRPGKDSKPFLMVKFRTMTMETDETGALLSDEKRLTSFGLFLRKTSLDELPELFNVLKGDMSLVGPRPLLMEYLDYYSKEQLRRHDVLPGVTGLAQVRGRNLLSWEKKFKLDLWYVDNWSLWLDLKILLLTVMVVFNGKGVEQEGHVTMEKFTGDTHGRKE